MAILHQYFRVEKLLLRCFPLGARALSKDVMDQHRQPPQTRPKASGRDIILAIGQTMERGLEPLWSRILAPSLYQVYLHSEDYDRLRNVFPKIEADARRHLDREVARLNRREVPPIARLRRALGRSRDDEDRARRYESTDGGWYIRFQEDPNGVLEPGDVEVVAELAVGDEPRYGAGSRTHRIISTTRRLGKMETREEVAEEPALAILRFEDDRGQRTYRMRQREIVIGRKAQDVWVDLDLHTVADISREHARIRRSEDGKFEIKDLSTYGVEVDGRHVPPSLVKADKERDLDLWTELPDRATIRLASVLTLEFEASAR